VGHTSSLLLRRFDTIAEEMNEIALANFAVNEYYAGKRVNFAESCASVLVDSDHPERPRDLDR
jgi:hypothetical protein